MFAPLDAFKCQVIRLCHSDVGRSDISNETFCALFQWIQNLKQNNRIFIVECLKYIAFKWFYFDARDDDDDDDDDVDDDDYEDDYDDAKD